MRPASRSSLTAAATSSAASGLPWVARATRATRLLESGRSAEPATSVAIAVSSRPPSASRSKRDRRKLAATSSRKATRSATRRIRRAANPSASREALSIHCASSTHASTGASAAAAPSRPSTAAETAKRSTGSSDIASAPRSAPACGGGSSLDQPEHRMQQLVDSRERELGLVLGSVRAQEAHVAGARRDGVEQRGLPHPGLACQHENPTVSRSAPANTASMRSSSASRPTSTARAYLCSGPVR